MRSKKMAPTSKIISGMIAGFIIYGTICGLIIGGIKFLLSKIIPSSLGIVGMIIAWVLDLIFILLVWRFSIKSTFRGRLININDVDKVMRLLFLISTIAVVIPTYISIVRFDKKIDASSTSLSKITQVTNEANNQNGESNNSTNSDEEKALKAQKEAIVNNIKHKGHVKIYVTNGGTLLVYLLVLPAVRRRITRFGI